MFNVYAGSRREVCAPVDVMLFPAHSLDLCNVCAATVVCLSIL